MAATRWIFTFKCERGHIMTHSYPPGTRVSDHDETTCFECLKISEVQKSYVVFVCAEQHNHGLTKP